MGAFTSTPTDTGRLPRASTLTKSSPSSPALGGPSTVLCSDMRGWALTRILQLFAASKELEPDLGRFSRRQFLREASFNDAELVWQTLKDPQGYVDMLGFLLVLVLLSDSPRASRCAMLFRLYADGRELLSHHDFSDLLARVVAAWGRLCLERQFQQLDGRDGVTAATGGPGGFGLEGTLSKQLCDSLLGDDVDASRTDVRIGLKEWSHFCRNDPLLVAILDHVDNVGGYHTSEHNFQAARHDAHEATTRLGQLMESSRIHGDQLKAQARVHPSTQTESRTLATSDKMSNDERHQSQTSPVRSHTKTQSNSQPRTPCRPGSRTSIRKSPRQLAMLPGSAGSPRGRVVGFHPDTSAGTRSFHTVQSFGSTEASDQDLVEPALRQHSTGDRNSGKRHESKCTDPLSRSRRRPRSRAQKSDLDTGSSARPKTAGSTPTSGKHVAIEATSRKAERTAKSCAKDPSSMSVPTTPTGRRATKRSGFLELIEDLFVGAQDHNRVLVGHLVERIAVRCGVAQRELLNLFQDFGLYRDQVVTQDQFVQVIEQFDFAGSRFAKYVISELERKLLGARDEVALLRKRDKKSTAKVHALERRLADMQHIIVRQESQLLQLSSRENPAFAFLNHEVLKEATEDPSSEGFSVLSRSSRDWLGELDAAWAGTVLHQLVHRLVRALETHGRVKRRLESLLPDEEERGAPLWDAPSQSPAGKHVNGMGRTECASSNSSCSSNSDTSSNSNYCSQSAGPARQQQGRVSVKAEDVARLKGLFPREVVEMQLQWRAEHTLVSLQELCNKANHAMKENRVQINEALASCKQKSVAWEQAKADLESLKLAAPEDADGETHRVSEEGAMAIEKREKVGRENLSQAQHTLILLRREEQEHHRLQFVLSEAHAIAQREHLAWNSRAPPGRLHAFIRKVLRLSHVAGVSRQGRPLQCPLFMLLVPTQERQKVLHRMPIADLQYEWFGDAGDATMLKTDPFTGKDFAVPNDGAMVLHFLCAHDLSPAGQGIIVPKAKDWALKFSRALRLTLLVIKQALRLGHCAVALPLPLQSRDSATALEVVDAGLNALCNPRQPTFEAKQTSNLDSLLTQVMQNSPGVTDQKVINALESKVIDQVYEAESAISRLCARPPADLREMVLEDDMETDLKVWLKTENQGAWQVQAAALELGRSVPGISALRRQPSIGRAT